MAIKKVATAGGETRYEVQARGSDGTQHGRRFSSMREARVYERKLADEREAARRGEHVAPAVNLTLAEWIDGYLASHTGVKPQTRRTLEDRLRSARKTLGATKLRELDRTMVGRWVNEELDEYATTTQRSYLKALRQVLKRAVDDGILRVNPAAETPLPKQTRPPINPFRSWAEVEKVAEKAGKWGELIRFGAATGLRLQELFAIQWGDVDLVARRLHVSRTVQDGRIVDGEAKTARSLRTIVLSARALDALDAHHPEPGAPDDLVFGGPDGRLLNLHNFRSRIWGPAVKAAGLRARGPKNLRHTFATLALTQDPPVPVQDVQRQLGHADIGTTLDYYVAYMPSQDDRLVRLLDADTGTGRRLPEAREAA